MAKPGMTDDVTVLDNANMQPIVDAIWDAIGDGTNAPTTPGEVLTNIGVSAAMQPVVAASTTDGALTALGVDASKVPFTPSGTGLAAATVSAQLKNSEFFDTVADLKAWSAPTVSVTAFVRGYYAAGVGGGGQFVWNSSDTTADNGGTVISPTSAPASGRWNLVWSDFVTSKQFGCKANGSDDDITFLQAMADLDPAVPFMLSEGLHAVSSTWKIRNSRTFIDAPKAGTSVRFGFGSPAITKGCAGIITLSSFAATYPVIEIGGDASSARYNSDSALVSIEDIYLGPVLIYPKAKDWSCGDGILIDGSDTRYASRGYTRSVVLNAPSVAYTNGKAFRCLGNVFNVTMLLPTNFQSKDTGFSIDTATVNIGVNRPGEITLVSPYSATFLSGVGVSGAKDYDLQYTTVLGGKGQGDQGARLGYQNSIFGLELERSTPAPTDSTKIALQLDNCRLNNANIRLSSGYGVGVQLGAGSSDANLCTNNTVSVDYISNGATGVSIVAGGDRSSCSVSVQNNSATTGYTNSRIATDAVHNEVNYSVSGKPVETIQTNLTMSVDSTETVAAAGTVTLPTAPIHPLSQTTGASITLDTATPISKTGAYYGQRITLLNVGSGSNDIVIPHSSNCRNKGQVSQTLKPGESISYFYSGNFGAWVQDGS